MNIIVFLIILGVLVFVHECGHFIVAKKSGIRVDEFAVGFPPRLWSKRVGETVYALNALPLGGYVKIFGENAESLEKADGTAETPERSFAHKSRLIQAAVISAGVTMNIIFAWLVISIGLMFGMPTAVGVTDQHTVSDAHVIINSVVADSPAEQAGLKAGDTIVALESPTEVLNTNVTPDTVHNFVTASTEPLTLSYKRGAETLSTSLTPAEGIVPDGAVIGITMDMVGTLRLSPLRAVTEGAIRTALLFRAVVVGIYSFFHDLFIGEADLSSVAGPVGMVALVGDAKDLGFAYLVYFTALLSINLAVINLIPFPALDGGRLVVIAIEAIRRKALPPSLIQNVNIVGFALLMLLMLVVTFHDILKLF
ncbi:MAG: RIP metalloprotease RseP [Candidatus Taylorbacteria bacterium]|nr:RIP metalloprotease RseP [Candidatus Taylorbacteria bacterium]